MFLLAGCSGQTPQAVDNGKPGKIEVFIYLDSNANGNFDAGEAGRVDEVAMPEMISCAASSQHEPVRVQTDDKGVALFSNLKAGRYCVSYLGRETTTTQLQAEVLVNSEQTTRVEFGIMVR